MTVTRGNLYSLVAAQFYRITSAGIPCGQLDPSSLGTNVTSHAYKIAGATEATIPEFTYSTFTFRDGQVVRGSVDGGLSAVPNITITTNAYDATLNKLFTGVKIDTTSLTNATITSVGTNVVTPYSIGVLLTAQIYNRDDGASYGDSDYVTFVIPRCTARVSFPNSFSQADGENPVNATITLTLQEGSKTVVGSAFGTNQGFAGNKEYMYSITAANPYALTSFVQDAAATTYITGYLPVSSAVTSGSTTNWFSVGGTVTAPTSISTSTATVTLAAAGSSGVLANAFYQTQFAAVS